MNKIKLNRNSLIFSAQITYLLKKIAEYIKYYSIGLNSSRVLLL